MLEHAPARGPQLETVARLAHSVRLLGNPLDRGPGIGIAAEQHGQVFEEFY